MASGPLTGDDSNNGSPSEYDNSPFRLDSCSHNRSPEYGHGAGSLRLENLVKVSLICSSKVGAKELKQKLVGELDRVRYLVKRIASKEFRDGISGSSGPGGYSHRQYSGNDARKKLRRTISEAGSMGQHDLKSLRGLDVSVAENNHEVGHIVEKEKRMVKDDQCYQNSNAPIRKDKVPMPEGKNKLKKNGAKRDGADKNLSMLFQTSGKLLKSCSDLLAKLMKHKHGWVFNKPVDVKRLQLHDYYIIVKHPMDLGTVKSRLSNNWYKSAEEFAEDVRLTFGNAMLYNPKGQDVHIMADLLLKVFEENWATLEAHYKPKRRSEIRIDASVPTETPSPALNLAPIHNAPLVHAPASQPLDRVPQLWDHETRTLNRAEFMTKPADSKSNTANFGHSGKMPVPKKPKGRAPENRPMTLEEKQMLSVDLQNLPSEKLGTVVEIIKKRNPPLSQEDDEIEVDIDAVDPETLWELDRFIANYKKGRSKNKREAELGLHTNAEVGQTIHNANLAPVTAESPRQTEIGNVELNFTSHVQLEKAPPSLQVEEPCSPAQVEKQGDNVSGSSTSSSDTGSSSNDSDSNSSSASGSDAGH